MSEIEPGSSAALHEAIVNGAPDAIVFADAAGHVRVWNASAEALFGYTAAEVLGGSLDPIIPERLRAAHWRGFQTALESGATKYSGQTMTTRAVHKDGRKLYVALTFSLLRDGSGRTVGAIASARDATAAYLAEREQPRSGGNAAGAGGIQSAPKGETP